MHGEFSWWYVGIHSWPLLSHVSFSHFYFMIGFYLNLFSVVYLLVVCMHKRKITFCCFFLPTIIFSTAKQWKLISTIICLLSFLLCFVFSIHFYDYTIAITTSTETKKKMEWKTIRYCAPTVILGYLYVHTARELRPPDGPLSVMMYEQRADIQNRQR